jgi:hypothetical protein
MDDREREIMRGAVAELACAELRERLTIVEKENEELAQLWRGEQKQTIACSRLLHDAEKARYDILHEFAQWLDYMILQGLAKQTRVAELGEMFMPSYLLGQYDVQLRKAGR